jgi:hypothetical protein
MTGWRIGYGVMRADLAAHITRLATNSTSCTASFTQMAGIEALRGDQTSVDRMCAEFKSRRDVFVAGLNKIKGFSCRMPKGAFYVFPNITKTGWKSKPLADALLEQAGVGRALRHRIRRVRRRLPSLQRGQLAGEPAAGPRPHRPMDQDEPVRQRLAHNPGNAGRIGVNSTPLEADMKMIPALCCLLLLLTIAFAQPPGVDALIGTWRLVEFADLDKNGKWQYRFGEHPRGYFVYDATGHVPSFRS